MPAYALCYGQEIIAYDLEKRSWLGLSQEVRRDKSQPLRCVSCDAPMHCARLSSPYFTQFFQHNGGYGHCPLKTCEGESREHYALKEWVHRAVSTTSGWASWPERRLGDPSDYRQPDITAVRDGKKKDRRAFEVQLSGISQAEVLNRIEDHHRYGARQSIWFVRHQPEYFCDIPAFELTNIEGVEVVTAGFKVRMEQYEDVSLPLPRVVRMILKNQIEYHDSIGWTSHRNADDASRAAKEKQKERNNQRSLHLPHYRECNQPPSDLRRQITPALPRWQTKEQRRMTDPNTFLMSSGVKSFKFAAIGATAKGTILSLDMQQQRDIKTQEPKFWDKEKLQPMLQLRIVLQTDEHEGDNDDGQRAIYAKGNMQNAVRDAIKNAGETKIDVGGMLAVKYDKDGEKTNPAFDPPKEYVAQYKAPEKSITSVSADDLL